MSELKRVHVGQAAPSVYRAMASLDKEVRAYANSAGLEPLLVDLVKIRASQINGCAFCLDMHVRDALGGGETTERIAVLPAWAETTFFTERERAALVLTESVTRIAPDRVPDEVYAAAASILSESEIAATVWVAVAINAWNRIAIASRYSVGPDDSAMHQPPRS